MSDREMLGRGSGASLCLSECPRLGSQRPHLVSVCREFRDTPIECVQPTGALVHTLTDVGSITAWKLYSASRDGGIRVWSADARRTQRTHQTVDITTRVRSRQDSVLWII